MKHSIFKVLFIIVLGGLTTIAMLAVFKQVIIWVFIGFPKSVEFQTRINDISCISFKEWSEQFDEISDLKEELKDFKLSFIDKKSIINKEQDYYIVIISLELENNNSFPINKITIDKVEFPFGTKTIFRKKDSTWYEEMFCKPNDTYEYEVEVIVNRNDYEKIKNNLSKEDILIKAHGTKSDIYE
jgi:hypothetical protein